LEDESCPEGFQLILKSDLLNLTFEEKIKYSFSIENLKSVLEVE
jgi:hypothetical protein